MIYKKWSERVISSSKIIKNLLIKIVLKEISWHIQKHIPLMRLISSFMMIQMLRLRILRRRRKIVRKIFLKKVRRRKRKKFLKKIRRKKGKGIKKKVSTKMVMIRHKKLNILKKKVKISKKEINTWMKLSI